MANEASKFTMADGTDVSIVDSRIGDLTSTGITGSTVAAQLKELNSNISPFIGVIKVHDTWVTGKFHYFPAKEGEQVISFNSSNGTNMYYFALFVIISGTTITKSYEYAAINGNAASLTNYMNVSWA